MDIDDICDGCSRFHSICVCSVSIGSDGVKHYRPDPTNFAGKLRIIASNSQLQEHKFKTLSVPEQIKKRAEQAAKGGRLSLDIWLSEYNLTEKDAEIVAFALEQDGFKCSLSDEITSQYSNTDWDSEWKLTISWK